MKSVSRFEADLLSILRFFLRRAPAEQALPLLKTAHDAPPCLSRGAVELVQETLAKGCTLLLARGGWRRKRFLRGETIAEGRLWERTPPAELGLHFSRQSLQFLIWVTASPLPARKKRPLFRRQELTAGDWLLFYLAHAALRSLEGWDAFAAHEVFAQNALCRLAFPQDFAVQPGPAAEDFAAWTAGVGAAVLEALQAELARSWEQAERDKVLLKVWPRLRAFGRSQEDVLAAFLGTLETGRRYDLARFLLVAADRLLAHPPETGDLIAGLSGSSLRLAERAEVYRAATVLLQQLDRLKGWEQQARSVGYFDEGYAAAQLWKADWENARGDYLGAAARGILHRGDAL